MLHYSVEEGLPSTNVYSIYRDTKGFLWFATDKGIARYNGLRFETFTTADGIPDNEVFFFREDRQHRLWLGTYNGELCFYRDGIFHTAANTSYLKMAKPQTHIYNITIERDSSITFNFYDPFVVANIKDERLNIHDFTSVKGPLIYPYIYYKRKISGNAYSMIYGEVVLKVDTLNNILSSEKRKWPGASVYVQVQDTGYFINIQSKLQARYHHLGCIQSGELDSVTSFSDALFKGKQVRAYYHDGKNRFFATNDGLSVNDTLWLLPGCDVSSMTRDDAGNYWISTLNAGVYRLSRDFLRTRIVANAYKGRIEFTSVANSSVYFTPQDKCLYRLSSGGLSRVFNYAEVVRGRDLYPDAAYFLDPAGEFFFNFKSAEYILANLKDRRAKLISYSIDSSRFKGAKKIFVEGDSLYLFGRSSINSFSLDALKNGKGRHFCKFDTYGTRFYSFADAPGYGIWFSTATCIYSLHNGEIVQLPQYKNVSFKNFTFLWDKIIGVTFKNELLSVSNIIGNVKIDTLRQQQRSVFGKLYKLNDDHVLLESGSLFYVLEVKAGGGYDLYPAENLSVPGQTNAVCVDSENCYFFKEGNIVVVPIANVLEKVTSPKLFFTTVKAGKRQFYNNVDIVNGELSLSYADAKSMVISFTKLLVGGRSVVQQYSISKNGEDLWRDLRGDDINLLNPGYGDCVVKIRAKTLSSSYCEPVVLLLHIARPFWATWWFMLIVTGCVIALVIAAVRYRIRYILHRNEKEHQKELKFVRSEYKALNALMNPHFVFNTLNNVQGLVNRDDKLAANEYIRVFADLIRQNMHNLSKELIPLQKEIELVVNYLLLEKLRFKELLNYAIDIDDKLDLSEIFVPPLLVQPLVENSIKHGILPLESVEGTVIIRIYEQGALLFIEVRDNGVGVAKAHENKVDGMHESFAMGNIKKRIEQLAIILSKRITLDMTEEKLPGEARRWTVVTISIQV